MQQQLKELIAMLLIGDGVVTLVQPQRHVRRWTCGPASYRRLMQAFFRRPGMTQVFSASDIALGIWWASRQRPTAQ